MTHPDRRGSQPATPSPSPREEREDMGDAMVLAHDWLMNTLVEAPTDITIATEGTIQINYFLDDGPRIRSIIEGVGVPSGTKWEFNKHGFFVEFDNCRIAIYTDNRSVWLPSDQLLSAFRQED